MGMQKKGIRRILSYIMIMAVLVVEFLMPMCADAEEDLNTQVSYYRHYSDDGTVMDIITEENDSEVIIKNFNDGVLAEQSRRKVGENVIYNEIFDLESENDMGDPQKIESNGITIFVTHCKRSDEKLNEIQKERLSETNELKVEGTAIAAASTKPMNVVGAPMDNTGLKASGYNDGYYYLSESTISTIPGVVGKLYRKYTPKNKGVQKRDVWDVGATVTSIASLVQVVYNIASGKAVSVVLAVITFSNNVVKVKQTVETQYHHFDYRYKVRVGSPVYFATDRQRYYWKIFNVNTGQYEWIEEVAAKDGFLDTDMAMIKNGIEEYWMKKPILTYQTHVQNQGWQSVCSEGDMSGTSGKNLQLEAIKIYLNSNTLGGTIQYRTHVQNKGWQGWVSSGALSGTSGKSLRLEAIQIRLTGGVSSKYRLRYRVHVQNEGWQSWKYDSETAGTSGKSLRLEAIEIRMVRK